MAEVDANTEDEKEEPGYCFGHWENKNKDCEICEIQDPCKKYTDSIGEEDNGKEEENESR